MRTTFVKQGNSLALRIPSALAKELGATEGKRAEMTVVDRTLVVKAGKKRRYALDELLVGLTPQKEIDGGPPCGREVQ